MHFIHQNCLIFSFYFINLFEILSFEGSKITFSKKIAPKCLTFTRIFFKNGKFFSYCELEPITTKIKEKIAYIPFFNFYFRHFLKFRLLNLQIFNIASFLKKKVILALYRVFCKMYTNTHDIYQEFRGLNKINVKKYAILVYLVQNSIS